MHRELDLFPRSRNLRRNTGRCLTQWLAAVWNAVHITRRPFPVHMWLKFGRVDASAL
jgi:hypothetical protein